MSSWSGSTSTRNEPLPEAELEFFMREALREAEAAGAAGEVPIGAVAVCSGRIVARARNRVEEHGSVTGHAEIELLRALERSTGDWRMDSFDVFVTKEPCPMCAGALVNARVRRIVFGVGDPAFGGCGGAVDIPGLPGALWHPEVIPGVLAEESLERIRSFFREARRRAKQEREKGVPSGKFDGGPKCCYIADKKHGVGDDE